MRKLLTLSALLAGLCFISLWPAPASAIIYVPCDDQVCPVGSTGHCSCPIGTPMQSKNTTCDQWQYFCYGC